MLEGREVISPRESLLDFPSDPLRRQARPAIDRAGQDDRIGIAREEQGAARASKPLVHVADKLGRDALASPDPPERNLGDPKPRQSPSGLGLLCVYEPEQQQSAFLRGKHVSSWSSTSALIVRSGQYLRRGMSISLGNQVRTLFFALLGLHFAKYNTDLVLRGLCLVGKRKNLLGVLLYGSRGH